MEENRDNFKSYDEENNAFIEELSSKEVSKLLLTAKQCENYFSNTNSPLSSLAMCFRCQMTDIDKNELLRFSTKKELMNYLKYCFIYQTNILCIYDKAFLKNKLDYFRCPYFNFITHWKFFLPKILCKCCFMLMINMNNLMKQLKTIFNDDNLSYINKSIEMNSIKQKNNNHNKRSSRKKAQAFNFRKKYKNRIGSIKLQEKTPFSNENQRNILSNKQSKFRQYNKNAIFDKEKNVIIIDKTQINSLLNEEESGLFDSKNLNKNDKNNVLYYQSRNIINEKQTEQVKLNDKEQNISNNQIVQKKNFASNKNVLEILSILNEMQKLFSQIIIKIADKSYITSPNEFQAILKTFQNYQCYIENHLSRIETMKKAIGSQLIPIEISRQNIFLNQLNSLEEATKNDLKTIKEYAHWFNQCGREYLNNKKHCSNLFFQNYSSLATKISYLK